MRKIVITLVCILSINNNLRAQDDGALAIAGAALAIGGAIAAVEQAKEIAEQTAMEYVLSERPDLTFFELKTDSFNGVKGKDISSVNILTFTIRDMGNKKRYVLYGFSQAGFTNANGLNFSKIQWKMFDLQEWNTMMSAYIELASDEKIPPIELTNLKIVNKGVKKGSDYVVKFDKITGDVYKVLDYSDDFKIIYNERSLGLFLKSSQGESGELYSGSKSSLVQVRRNIIISTHEFLNQIK